MGKAQQLVGPLFLLKLTDESLDSPLKIPSVHFNRAELHTGADRVSSGQMQGRTRITTLRMFVRIP
jgi:hypothetical protein